MLTCDVYYALQQAWFLFSKSLCSKVEMTHRFSYQELASTPELFLFIEVFQKKFSTLISHFLLDYWDPIHLKKL